MLVGVVFFGDAGYLGLLEPGYGGFDGGYNGFGGLGQGHEEEDDAGGLLAAEGGEFVGAGTGGLQGLLVVLGAPDGELAVLLDLGIEDALDAFVEGGLGEALYIVGHVAIGGLLLADLTQYLQDVDHGVVVVGDVGAVAVVAGPELGEAAVGVLALHDVEDAAQGAVGVLGDAGGGVEAGEVADFGAGGAVVDGALAYVVLGGVDGLALLVGELAGDVDVLGPSAADVLIEEDVVADAPGFVGGEELIGEFGSEAYPADAGELLFVADFGLLCAGAREAGGEGEQEEDSFHILFSFFRYGV